MTPDSPTCLNVTYPGGQYDVFVGRHLLAAVPALARIDGPIAIITNDEVGPLYADQVREAQCVVEIATGEQYKTLQTVRDVYDRLLSAGLDRTTTIVALGGGVVGDVAGFVAATYLRGVPLVQCPTSLLAMVDASVGGKTGVDLPQGKNLVGAFKQPVAVVADLETLHTLAPVELAAGMAEVVKHGLISSPDLLARLAAGEWRLPTAGRNQGFEPGRLQQLVVTAIQVKRDVVQADPYERGLRATLNLGHSFAHAIEQVSGYEIRHGEAVAMGLVAAAELSQRLGHCPPDLQSRIERVLTRFDLPTRIPPELAADALLAAMARDKKRAAGRLRFILMREVGDVFVSAAVPPAAVAATLAACRG